MTERPSKHDYINKIDIITGVSQLIKYCKIEMLILLKRHNQAKIISEIYREENHDFLFRTCMSKIRNTGISSLYISFNW